MVGGFDMTLPLILQFVFGWLCLAALGVGLVCTWLRANSAEAASRDVLSGFSRRDDGLRLGSRLRALLPVPALRPVPVVALHHSRHRERPEPPPAWTARLRS